MEVNNKLNIRRDVVMLSILSKEEADILYTSRKQITWNHGWENKDKSSHKAHLEVICEDGTPLDIKGTANFSKAGQHYSFVLLYKKSIVIRRWDDTRGHLCPITKKIMNGSHKHYYHPDYGDSPAYENNDITLNDVNKGLIDFLKECNIETMGHIFTCILNSNLNI
jgi:hypothetical protein